MNEINDLFNLAMTQLSTLGQVLLDDDWHDVGWFSYFDRYGHPDHPSPLHHWQYGAFLIFIAEAFKKMVEFLNVLGINVGDVFRKIHELFFNGSNKQQSLLGDLFDQ